MALTQLKLYKMKVYNSIEEGVWTTPNKYPITSEEIALLNAEETEENKEAKDALKATIVEYLKTNPTLVVTEDELVVLNNLYGQNKPELTEEEVYQLIDAAIFKTQNQEGDDIYSGIINCRVIKEEVTFDSHKQIRF